MSHGNSMTASTPKRIKINDRCTMHIVFKPLSQSQHIFKNKGKTKNQCYQLDEIFKICDNIQKN